MSNRAIGCDGVCRVYGDSALRQRINDLIQKRFSSESDSTQKIASREAILNHPYLVIDDWSCAEQRDRQERTKRCRKMLEGLKIRMRKGEIRQEGVEGTRGDTSLTPTKLDRHIRLLDLSENWLLLSIERHPFGGSETVREQYWFYSKKYRSIRLVHDEDIMYPDIGPLLVKQGDGPWQDTDNSLEKDFRRVVEDLLGTDALKCIERNIGPPDDSICTINPDVLAKCKTISGIDYEAEEESRRLLREKVYLKRYGPRTPRGPGLALAPVIGIVLQTENEKNSESKENLL